MAKPHPSDPVYFGQLAISFKMLEAFTDEPRKRWLQRQICGLSHSEIGTGLTQPNGKVLLQRACEIAGLDYQEIARG